jgi:hypothetical protein
VWRAITFGGVGDFGVHAGHCRIAKAPSRSPMVRISDLARKEARFKCGR